MILSPFFENVYLIFLRAHKRQQTQAINFEGTHIKGGLHIRDLIMPFSHHLLAQTSRCDGQASRTHSQRQSGFYFYHHYYHCIHYQHLFFIGNIHYLKYHYQLHYCHADYHFDNKWIKFSKENEFPKNIIFGSSKTSEYRPKCFSSGEKAADWHRGKKAKEIKKRL